VYNVTEKLLRITPWHDDANGKSSNVRGEIINKAAIINELKIAVLDQVTQINF
jgi:hypothetical protein